jgi:hypothetical protein
MSRTVRLFDELISLAARHGGDYRAVCVALLCWSHARIGETSGRFAVALSRRI